MKPKIIIDNEVFRKVMYWVNKSQYEVSGLGLIKVEGSGVFRVTSTMLLPQKNGATHTDIEPEDVNRALYELRHAEGDLKWWWHSHVNMAVFWSGTDMDTIKKLGEGGWFANSVFNKKREVRSSIYTNGIQTPWKSPLFLDELETVVSEFTDQKEMEWGIEYEKNVQETKWTSVVPYAWQRPTYSGDYSGKNHVRALTQPRTGTTETTGTTSTAYDATVQPPANRPPSMTKRVYKAWKRAWRENLEAGLTVAEQRTNRDFLDMTDGNVLEMPDDTTIRLDDYGFTQEERQLLASEGWDDFDVDELLERDVTPTEMIQFATHGVAPREVSYLLDKGHPPEQIVEMLERAGRIVDGIEDGLDDDIPNVQTESEEHIQ